MTSLEHPEKRLEREPTPAQADLLRRIVSTNGGGVSGYNCNRNVLAGLVKRHMVQGKAGNQSRVVHTKIGLEWVRANP